MLPGRLKFDPQSLKVRAVWPTVLRQVRISKMNKAISQLCPLRNAKANRQMSVKKEKVLQIQCNAQM